jgi:hypothetical protein
MVGLRERLSNDEHCIVRLSVLAIRLLPAWFSHPFTKRRSARAAGGSKAPLSINKLMRRMSLIRLLF